VQRDLARQPYAVESLARQESEDLVSASNGGRLPPLTAAELTEQFGTQLAAAIRGMSDAVSAPPSMLEDEKGIRLIRLLRHEPAASPDFHALKAGIQRRIRAARRDPDYQAFLSKLASDAHLHIDDGAVGALFTDVANKP
jgi:hypothetical protein